MTAQAQTEVVLKNKYGLHVRPATLIAQTAKDFQCSVVLLKDEQEVDARSIFSMLTLAAEKGSKITIKADGDDAEQAVAKLAEVIGNFDVDD